MLYEISDQKGHRVEDIEREFLLATSYLQIDKGEPIVSLGAVAENLGFPISGEFERNYYIRLARGLGMRGLLQEKGGDKTSHWETFVITEKGLEELEGRQRGGSGDTNINFHGDIGVISNSILGARDNAQLVNNFDFAAMQQEIDEKGGDDRQELTQLRQEIEEMLREGKQVDRGTLGRFAGVVQRNGWITSHLGGALVSFATQQMPPL